MRTTLYLLLLTAMTARLGGEDWRIAPSFTYLPSREDNSALSMECDGRRPFDEMRCTFTQVTVSKPSVDDTKELEESLRELGTAREAELRKPQAS